MEDYERFNLASAALVQRWPNSEGFTHEAEAMRESATTYVWGWQDGSGVEKDSQDAYRFGLAYGTVAALYRAELLWMRPNIADAYKSWREYGAIVEWRYAGNVPTALDHIEAPQQSLPVA
jgi:hypothetical protein